MVGFDTRAVPHTVGWGLGVFGLLHARWRDCPSGPTINAGQTAEVGRFQLKPLANIQSFFPITPNAPKFFKLACS
jgi:hypothetical protein